MLLLLRGRLADGGGQPGGDDAGGNRGDIGELPRLRLFSTMYMMMEENSIMKKRIPSKIMGWDMADLTASTMTFSLKTRSRRMSGTGASSAGSADRR